MHYFTSSLIYLSSFASQVNGIRADKCGYSEKNERKKISAQGNRHLPEKDLFCFDPGLPRNPMQTPAFFCLFFLPSFFPMIIILYSAPIFRTGVFCICICIVLVFEKEWINSYEMWAVWRGGEVFVSVFPFLFGSREISPPFPLFFFFLSFSGQSRVFSFVLSLLSAWFAFFLLCLSLFIVVETGFHNNLEQFGVLVNFFLEGARSR